MQQSTDSTIQLPDYDEARLRIDSLRKNLGIQLTQANADQRKIILQKVDSLLLQSVNNLYSYWKGTAWDFNGITQVPQKGSIACGYFVTTMLKHAGHPLNRVKLATCASMQMMKELTGAGEIKNLSRLSYDEFSEIMAKDPGVVYIVGLDFHTGFILTDNESAWFLHSNYIDRKGVVKERLAESEALKSSKTRYITRLTGNEKFLSTWLVQ